MTIYLECSECDQQFITLDEASAHESQNDDCDGAAYYLGVKS
jgi:hypothetical protein